MVGDTGVGKSCILSRFVKNEFNVETKSTIGVEYGLKLLTINDIKVKIQIWDTAGIFKIA